MCPEGVYLTGAHHRESMWRWPLRDGRSSKCTTEGSCFYVSIMDIK